MNRDNNCIVQLALRAGNEKDENAAKTVGCCSLRVENIILHEGQEHVVQLDFLGKDSIRYNNRIPVEKVVFENLKSFKDKKDEGDQLFDHISTASVNAYLSTFMKGLSCKVFRTYHASKTFEEQLATLSSSKGFERELVSTKMARYCDANRTVAILLNHKRAVAKNFDKQIDSLQSKIDAIKRQIKEAEEALAEVQAKSRENKSAAAKANLTKKKNKLHALQERLHKLEVELKDKIENKEIALSTSKLNYIDPRISVAWAKKWNVPLGKVFNKTELERFAWAVDTTTKEYHFCHDADVTDQ